MGDTGKGLANGVHYVGVAVSDLLNALAAILGGTLNQVGKTVGHLGAAVVNTVKHVDHAKLFRKGPPIKRQLHRRQIRKPINANQRRLKKPHSKSNQQPKLKSDSHSKKQSDMKSVPNSDVVSHKKINSRSEMQSNRKIISHGKKTT